MWTMIISILKDQKNGICGNIIINNNNYILN